MAYAFFFNLVNVKNLGCFSNIPKVAEVDVKFGQIMIIDAE